jgi:thymidylate kinase
VTPAELAAAYRIVVIDGCDGTGKTTLAGQLADHHGYQVVHSPMTPDDVDLAGRYRSILGQPGRVVLDRCFVSELVYGPLHRGRSRLTAGEAAVLAKAVADAGGVFIHLTGEPAAVCARLLARDGTADPNQVAALLAGYERAFAAIAEHATVVQIDITASG